MSATLTVVGGRIVHATEDQIGTTAPLGPPGSGSSDGLRQAEVIAEGSKDAQ